MATEESVSKEPRSSTKRRSLEEPEASKKHNVDGLENALRFMVTLNPSTVTRGNIKLHLAIDEIVKHSQEEGLTPDQIKTLVDVITSPNKNISQTLRTKFVKCLLPSMKVPQSVVVRVISYISTRIFSTPGPSNLHSTLLRWILLTFDYLDGYDQLHKVYDIIFQFVNSYLLLPHACHLLFLLTRKCDVRLYKVHKLLELTNKIGPEPYLVGLLMIYKVFCPHLVSMRLSTTHKVYFKAHDVVWRSHISAVVNGRLVDDQRLAADVSNVKMRREKEAAPPRSKKQKLVVPGPHSAADEVQEEKDIEDENKSVPFEQIESFTDFLDALEKIEYPSQIATALNDRRLQLLLSCEPDRIVITRLCFWIQHVFAFGFKGADKDGLERNEKLLQMLLTFSQNVQGLPIVEGFLESYLPTWNGQSYAPLIFSLITCIRPSSYQELHCSILEPLHRLFFSSDVYFKSMCITSLTKLIQNLSMEAHLQIVSKEVQQKGPSVSKQSEMEESREDTRPSPDVTKDHEATGEGSEKDKVLTTIQTILFQLVSLLDGVIVVGMRMENDHYLLQSTALDLIYTVSVIFQKYCIPLVCLPIRMIHRLLLSDCPATLARLCGIINSFREAFTSLRNNSEKWNTTAITCDTMVATQVFQADTLRAEGRGKDKFNALLLDALGMLWQGRLFAERRNFKSIFQFKPPSHLEGKLKDNALTIYNGPAFLALAYKFLKETQGEDKKVHPLQIEGFKDTYLVFLERENFPEFKQLVSLNIKGQKT
ncbi:centromere protein I-like [Physella acuta]|uniref:centromere protein I-like n=1 Tax=Physella acuta TaxID=109671 RepID=UPI0027DC2F81|nr:centromere protein I-like [Physella acuta]